MDCKVCSHSWCWTCGLSNDHIYHKFTGQVFCAILNNIAFGFELKCHWSVRMLVLFLFALIAPLWGYIVFIIINVIMIYEKVTKDS